MPAPSSSAITGKIWSTSRSVISANEAATARLVAQQPSATSTFSASRSGRETASCSHSAASSTKLPGASSPAKICWRSVSAAWWCKESAMLRMVAIHGAGGPQ